MCPLIGLSLYDASGVRILLSTVVIAVYPQSLTTNLHDERAVILDLGQGMKVLFQEEGKSCIAVLNRCGRQSAGNWIGREEKE